MKTTVLLYYKYVAVAEPEAEHQAQRTLCAELGLLGRILIGDEGINGTVAGPKEATDAYIAAMNTHQLFSGIDYKVDTTDTNPFPRLRIKVRPEIVSLGVAVDPAMSAPKLTPAEFHAKLSDPNVVVFDARNNYESAIGRFEGAVTPDVKLFKDLPAALGQYEDLKDKTVLTYCTGGIRCEKASALMRQRGFKDVYQLDGGIIKYAQEFPDGQYKGDCFVFDDRMAMSFKENPELLGVCIGCDSPTNDYYNCALPPCNALILVCEDCALPGKTCSATCATAFATA